MATSDPAPGRAPERRLLGVPDLVRGRVVSGGGRHVLGIAAENKKILQQPSQDLSMQM